MKKKLILGIVITLLTFVFNVNNALTQTGSTECDNAFLPAGTTCLSWTDTTVTINVVSPISSYPSCTATIIYYKRSCTIPAIGGCPAKTIYSYRIGSIDWDWDACPGFTAYLFPGYPDDFSDINVTHFKEVIGDIQRILGINNFSAIYSSLTPAEQLPLRCVDPYCSLPSCSTFEISFTNPTCMALCQEYTRYPVKRLKLTFIPCEPISGVCCKKEFKMCYCVSTQTVKVIEITSTLGNSDCPGTTPSQGCVESYDPKTGNYTMLMSCYAYCD